MNVALKMACCFLLAPALALAQSQTASDTNPATTSGPVKASSRPVAAATGRLIEVSLGYEYVNLDMPSSGRVNLSGVNSTMTADILPRIGVTADFGYARAANLLDTGHHVDVLSYLAGPVFYPVRAGRLTTFIHGLIGGARVTGVVPTSDSTDLLGYANRVSWAMGGGVRYQVTPNVAFQISSDYLRTGYVNSNAAIRGQNNVRTVCGVVYSFWKHSMDDN